MFDTKLEVDRHVESCMKKINNETERNLKCMAFARLYFKVGDYEQARRYVAAYLTVKPLSAEALSLLGKSLEKLGKREAAIEAYRKSLDIDPKQNNLVLKVCELLSTDDVTHDLSGARYYCEKAQSFDPHNPVVFNLKERLIAAESQDPNDVSQLLLAELASRPADVHLRIRFLRHLLQNNQIREAYKHVYDIEQKHLPIFLNNLSWYETISEVLIRYQRDNMTSSNLSWEFWILLTSVLDKLVALTLDESSNHTKNGSECVSVVFNFDQTLDIAIKNVTSCNERSFIQEFITHYRAQLCFHLGTLLFKQAKRDLIKYKDAMQMALPVLFASYHTQPAELHCMWLEHSTENRRQQVQRWHTEAAFRCSQAGHILLAAAKDRKVTVVEKAMQSCSGLWREQLFKKLFVTRDQQAKLKSSYFVTNQYLLDITLRLPDNKELAKYDEIAQIVYPDSLHHLIWICMNRKLPSFRCTVFDGLQYSVKNLHNCAAESLSILDIDAFLYCTTLCVQQMLEEMKHQIFYNADKPQVLPAAVTNLLGTLNQTKWLKAAYKMYRNEYGSDMSELRLHLIRGIEVVRCVGNHGLDVKLLVTLARTFVERAKNLDKQSEIEFNEARAELYWKAALPLLEKLQKNQAVTYAANRFFEYKSKEMSPVEILNYMEEGRLFNATQLMKKREHEKALQIFESLKSPYASFHQAQIYKTMADEQVNQNKENVTSEMRSQHIILLSRARDCLYLTLDRLRDPSVDRKHPLNTQLGTEIEKIERLLSRIDPDVYSHRNECDGMSDENVSSAGSIGDHMNNMYSSNLTNSFYPNDSLTPQYDRNMHSNRFRLELPTRREARPSPERLDAQLRQMQASRDATISHILEQNRIMIESHRSLVEELRSFKDVVTSLTSTVDDLKTVKQSVNEELHGIKESVNGLKSAVDDLQNFRDVTDLVHEMKKEIADLKKDSNKPKNNQLSDEDLYVLDEEYGNDYVLNSNVPTFNAGNLYPNYQPRMPSTNALSYPHAAALYPSLYPMYPYTNLGLPQPGALSFGQEPQISDFRTLNPLSQALPQATYGHPNYSQAKMPWDVSGVVQPGITQLNLMQPTLTIPQPQQPQVSIFKDANLATTSSVITTASATLSNLFSSSISVTSSHAPPTTVPSTKGPVNVVITSSDPLPKAAVATTQVLSVTIPPQHLKGNQPPKSQPHNYQIPLPTTSALSATPTIINQPPPIISTQGLLSNIAPPVYSAIEKSPSKSTGLGLQIEKSLTQTLNSSYAGNETKTDLSNLSSTSVEEHDPCPDFKPVIPLPDEVPVNTGEENETVLFCERAKLFRYVNKEWRERGVGNIKILKCKDNGKIRILMRRDQVHKICANHFLTKGMVLTQMPNNARAYMWAAHDYADEEMIVEKLCVRFKTEEEANAFYTAFEKAKESLPDSDVGESHVQESSPAKAPETTTLLGGFIFTSTPTFKPKEQPSTPKVTVPQETKLSPFASFTFGSKAATDIFLTPTTEFKPVQVPADAKVATPKSPGGGDDFEPTAEFAPAVPLPELVEVKTGEENAEILFESRAKLLRFDSAAKEWKERGIGIMKLLKETTIRLVMRREQVHKVCCNHQLMKTMQFTKMPANSKALTWYAQDFSEGVLKTEMFAVRFKSEEQAEAFYKAITSAQDLLDENNVVKLDQKVTIPEIKSDDSKESNKSKSKEEKKVKSEPKVEPPKSCEKIKVKLANWECKNCFIINEGKDHLCVACETPKSNTSPKKSADAEKSGTQFSFGINLSPASTASIPTTIDIMQKSQYSFGTPSTTTVTTSTAFLFGQNSVSSWGDAFKPKENTWECPQCLIRNESQHSNCLACNYAREKPKNETKQQQGGANSSSSWGNMFKPKEGSWECKQCFVRNDADKIYCVACDGPKDGTMPKKESSGINLATPGLQFNFGIQSNSDAKATGFTFASKPSSTFSFGTVTLSPADSTTTTTSKPFTFSIAKEYEDKKEEEKSENRDQFVFGSPQKHTFEFTPRSPRRHSSGCQGDEEGDSFVEDEGEHIYFKPVIPLPDKIDVKTGEEQEEVLYCHRAKLFRFVQGEWKERGIGDIKILKADAGRLRVLMRRDQVLKICLNHILTSDIDYLPKDDKTWLFTAPDYSEGEINHSQFCVRFKNPEIAQDFKKAAENALKKSASRSDTTKTSSVEDTDVEFISETQVTPEEEQEAINLKLPPKFMSYRQLPDCTCETCKKDDEILSELFNKTSLPKQQQQQQQKQEQKSIFGNSSTIFSTPCKPHSFGSTDASGKFVFGQPFKGSTLFGSPTVTAAPSTTPNTLSKSESLKDMLMKPSVLGNIAANNKSNESTPTISKSGSLFSTSDQTKIPSPAMKNFSFTFKTDVPIPPTTNLFSQTSSIFGGGTTTPVSSIFSNTSNTLFSSNNKTGDSMFGGFQATTGGNIFGSSTPGNLFATPPTTSASVGNIFGGGGGTGKSLFTPSATTTPSVFSNVAVKEVTAEPKKEEEIVLKCDSDLSFASLAATAPTTQVFTTPTTTEDNSKPFAFLGSGAPVFASLNKTQKSVSKKTDKDKTQSGDEGEGSDGEAGGGEEYDPHYEPIVPLPDAIVVSTGEEEETVLFNERAKLYRFDNQNKEWKERGVGQMKILHHPVNGTYRFLLRREQVHKVVLNMLITPNTELQPMSTSNKAWLWYGHNYSDDETALEQLAVRFKSCELAVQFYNVAQDTIKAVKELQENKNIPSTIQNYGVEQETSQEGDDKVTEEQEGEEDDEDDDDDDDDRTIMFTKQCDLSEQLQNGEWKYVGSGELQVYYDSDIYGSRISVINTDGLMLSNTVIGINTEMTLQDDHSCIWRAVEWTEVTPRWRTLKAAFTIQQAADELHCNYLESVQFAHESDLVDDILAENSDTDEN